MNLFNVGDLVCARELKPPLIQGRVLEVHAIRQDVVELNLDLEYMKMTLPGYWYVVEKIEGLDAAGTSTKTISLYEPNLGFDSPWVRFASDQKNSWWWQDWQNRKPETWQTYQRRMKLRRHNSSCINPDKCFCGQYFAVYHTPDAVVSKCFRCNTTVSSSKWDVTNTKRLSNVEHERTQEIAHFTSGSMLRL